MKAIIKSSYLILMVAITACGTVSSTDPAPVGVSKMELLAGKNSKTWEYTAITIDGADAFTLNKPCTKDDILMLTTAKNYERNEGPTKCKSADAQTYEKGTWVLGTDEISLTFSNSANKYKIVTLTSSTLVTSYKNVGGEIIQESYKVQSSN